MSLLNRRLLGLLLFTSAFVFLSGRVNAQTNEGILAGTVVDQTGAAIEGASVTAKNEATGFTQASITGAGGTFRFPNVPIGLYDLKVSHPGFTSQTQTGVSVQISTTTAVNISLNVGKAEQTVTVVGDTTRIETESSDIGTVISSKQVIELPLALGGVGALRSPEAFIFLAPGTAGPGTANSNNGIFISKLGGGQNFGADVLLDGTSILRTENGSSFDEAAPSVEAISEFKILTSTIPATYGRTTGAIETFTTKSGTNQFHGTAYDILQNEDLNANSWFNNADAAQCAPGDSTCRAKYVRPVDKKNDYGGNLGGPVWIPKIYNGKNRTFFFFNWEQYNQHIGGTNTSIVPTAAERTGDFSGSLNTGNVLGTNPCTGAPIYEGEIFDPNTTAVGPTGVPCRLPFAGNKIPTSRISAVAGNFLGYLPSPNIATQPNGVNYALSSSTPLQNTTYTLRIDQSISDKSKIFGMYDTRDNARYAGAGFYTFPPPADSNGWNQNFVTHYGRAGWDYIISPTLLNHLALGYNRTNSQNYTPGAQQAISGKFNWAAKLGISGLSGIEFPIVNMGEGVPAIGRANADDNVDNGERFNDILTWIKGKHSFSFGFDFRNQLYATYAFDTDTGVYNFSRAQTAADQSVSGSSGNGIASFLLGDLNNANAFLQGHVPRWTFQYYAGFAQDDWKVTPHLTLNLGLRYSVDVPRSESHNDTSNFDPNTPNPAAGNLPGGLVFGNTCSGCNPKWADTKFHDVAPRFGFAYNPGGGRFVIRGGYGILYGPLQYTDFGGDQVQGYSATPTFSSPNGFDPAFNWDNGFPAFPPPPTLNPSVVNKGNPNWIQPRFGQPAIIQSWSFQVQGQVSKDMIATLGYVGSRAQNLRSAIMNWNNIPIQDLNLGPALNQPVTKNTVGVTAPYPNFFADWGSRAPVFQAIRPFPQYDYIYMDVLQNIGQSTFQSLQATLQRRFSAGLSLQGSFTWSKTLTDADSILPGINGGISQIQNPADLNSEKALSSQDIPYMFTLSFLYELPFGRGKALLNHGIGAAVLGGWQVGAVLRYQTGVPISFGCSNSIPGWQNCIRFNRVQGVSPLSPQVLNGTFDPFANRYFNGPCTYAGQAGCGFADPNTELVSSGSSTTVQDARGGAYYLGDYPRNNPDARAPNYYNEDISIIRNFHIFERLSLQAKGELLNAPNRHIFSVPDTAPYDSNFGQVNGTIDQQRIVQFTLRLNF
ncbi:MAG TPA: TonB-dependent receptor [Bryobacteraceae bacterium]|nr:TonB-dependent receptor [Bryobacteraceae bacterium]